VSGIVNEIALADVSGASPPFMSLAVSGTISEVALADMNGVNSSFMRHAIDEVSGTVDRVALADGDCGTVPTPISTGKTQH
jgi:hypothetical protein